jgi:gamma-glutamylputrescine oxidase
MSTLAFWLDEPYEPRPALSGDLEVEACVIGAGVGGLSCARRLAQHGIETVVLERDTVAGGASGRNGGFLLAGLAAFHVDANQRYGSDYARAVYARTLTAQEEIYALAAELGAGDAVRRTGLLRVAASQEEAEHVRGHVAALHADGFPGELLEREQLPPALRKAAWNACLTEHDGSLHPARWIRALARAAEQEGARIHEGSPVEGPLEPGAAVASAAGSVRARHVIAAADGALPALVPGYRGRVRARRLHMVATAPLSQAVSERPVYSRWGYEYFQQLPDGRLLAGGFSDLDAEQSYTDRDEGSARVWERIERWLGEALGVEAPVTHRWVGVVGYSEDDRPFVEAVPGGAGLYVAGGYSGTGNVVGYVAGQELADLVAGATPQRLFAR